MAQDFKYGDFEEIRLFKAIFNQAIEDLQSTNTQDRIDSIQFFKSKWSTTVADYAGMYDQFDETYNLLMKVRSTL